MPQIEVDFEVWKALTLKRHSESHSYNDVLRELLDIDTASVIRENALAQSLVRWIEPVASLSMGPTTGIALRGLVLPNGTRLRATHKGTAHAAQIVDGKWVSDGGEVFGSPSAAATAITGNNVNGWRFWQAKRPSDGEWRILDSIPKN